ENIDVANDIYIDAEGIGRGRILSYRSQIESGTRVVQKEPGNWRKDQPDREDDQLIYLDAVQTEERQGRRLRHMLSHVRLSQNGRKTGAEKSHREATYDLIRAQRNRDHAMQ